MDTTIDLTLPVPQGTHHRCRPWLVASGDYRVSLARVKALAICHGLVLVWVACAAPLTSRSWGARGVGLGSRWTPAPH